MPNFIMINNKNYKVMKLKETKLYAGIFALMLLFSTGSLSAQDNEMRVEQERLMDAEKREVIKSDAEDAKAAFIAKNPEMKEHFQNAEGYAIFPNVGKGAYVLGGAAGNGVLYEDGQVEGYAQLRQLDIGFQIGGKAFREVIIFRTEEALQEFKDGGFEFGGSVSAVIWDEGRTGTLQFEDGVAVALMPKAGAMAGVSVGGQQFDYRPANQ